ncbi:hypothetical protein EV421DRAFT_1743427 [Armillaria borealis]|uniref:Heterokaryon incompatibility domain-containing protein n=1 Tax=Armillaria borealis TaxID=47425 RepID=A0AA39IWN0_9AGAR|nr:hypothetical protein EV421DRAFT_1743427 [Armillaria borealis]
MTVLLRSTLGLSTAKGGDDGYEAGSLVADYYHHKTKTDVFGVKVAFESAVKLKGRNQRVRNFQGCGEVSAHLTPSPVTNAAPYPAVFIVATFLIGRASSSWHRYSWNKKQKKSLGMNREAFVHRRRVVRKDESGRWWQFGELQGLGEGKGATAEIALVPLALRHLRPGGKYLRLREFSNLQIWMAIMMWVAHHVTDVTAHHVMKIYPSDPDWRTNHIVASERASYLSPSHHLRLHIGKEESSIEVPKQRSYTGRKPVISSSLANTPCASLGVAGILDQLNTTLGTSNYDFGAAYGRLHPIWCSANWSTIQNELCTREEKDQKMQREALVGNRIVNPNMPPRRVWDLYSNLVVPQWIISDKKPWAISYAWTDPEHRVQVDTPINAHEWPVPIHKKGSLDLVRIEMLNLGAEYVWLDVLCVRRHGKQENSEHLCEEEWMTNMPTSGYVYHQTEMVVYYFCGLGGAFNLTMDDLDGPRFWLNRAWTLQEISRKWVIGGITGDGTVTTVQTIAERDHQAVLDRIHEQLETIVDTVHCVDNVFDLLVHLRKRKSEHAVDHVAALISLFDQHLWPAVVNTMRTKHRGDMFFLYPRPGSEHAWRPSWNQVITERRLPTGKVILYTNVGRDEETNSDWYDGVCIEEGRVQGLDANDPKGLVRQGKLVVKDDTGALHSLEIVATHPLGAKLQAWYGTALLDTVQAACCIRPPFSLSRPSLAEAP